MTILCSHPRCAASTAPRDGFVVDDPIEKIRYARVRDVCAVGHSSWRTELLPLVEGRPKARFQREENMIRVNSPRPREPIPCDVCGVLLEKPRPTQRRHVECQAEGKRRQDQKYRRKVAQNRTASTHSRSLTPVQYEAVTT